MLPIVTPAEMAAIDAEAPEPVEVLIARAGWATARAARRLLTGPAPAGTGGAASARSRPGCYGRRVAVLAGPGNNGADGRAAAGLLARWGVRCEVVDVGRGASRAPLGRWREQDHDLIIDAAFGTGFRGRFEAPSAGGAPVLAVDIPSGIDGLTGEADGFPLPATATVTFAALKPGLVVGEGPVHAGTVEVVDIGLDVGRARAWLLTPDDLGRWPARPRLAHKWASACWVIGGSPGMTGAPQLAVAGAQRAGAGYVRLSVPGMAAGEVGGPIEAVAVDLPAAGWPAEVLARSERVAAFIVGPGLGRGGGVEADVQHLLARLPLPVVLDGDGLRAVAGRVRSLRDRPAATVLTPHDGEFAYLAGGPPGPDRLGAARRLARESGAVVLLKGPSTVVADPSGRVLVSTAGDERLATAGTGDVLAGVVGAALARGADPWLAAGLAAEAHGAAARNGPAAGLVAGDIARHLATVLDPEGATAGGHPNVRQGVPIR